MTIAEVWEAIKALFADMNWGLAIAELLLAFVLINYVFRILRENNASKLMGVYSAILLGGGVVFLFADKFSATAYFTLLLILSLFFLLLFSTEIKRKIWTGKWGSVVSPEHTLKTTTASRAEECITAILRAVQNLSKNNTGALIILSNGNVPKEILDSGVRLNANISSQLIEGIFINKAPLHDGAMIIHSDKIEAAGCFLPLTQKDLPKDYGTRHRAGIGVTEVADVSTIIVSEETGIVSTVVRGVITRYIDSEALNKFLRAYYWKELNGEAKSHEIRSLR